MRNVFGDFCQFLPNCKNQPSIGVQTGDAYVQAVRGTGPWRMSLQAPRSAASRAIPVISWGVCSRWFWAFREIIPQVQPGHMSEKASLLPRFLSPEAGAVSFLQNEDDMRPDLLGLRTFLSFAVELSY